MKNGMKAKFSVVNKDVRSLKTKHKFLGIRKLITDLFKIFQYFTYPCQKTKRVAIVNTLNSQCKLSCKHTFIRNYDDVFTLVSDNPPSTRPLPITVSSFISNCVTNPWIKVIGR